MSTVLVTGATGTIGSNTATALLDAGHPDVRLGVRDPSKVADLVARGATAVRFDYDDPASMQAAFAGVDAALLVAPFVDEPGPLVARALAAARAAGGVHIVRLSAAGAAPDAPAIAGKHGRIDAAMGDHADRWTVLRPNFFVDNLWKFQTDAIRAGGWYGAGEGAAAWIAAADVGAVAAAILREPAAHHGATYDLTGPEALTEAQLAGFVSDAVGRPVAYTAIGDEALAAGMAQGGVPSWMAEDLLFLETVKANGWAAGTTDTVAKLLGRPATSAAAYIRSNAGRW
jgi:uncharacterized protein YbjT (DUF2867 family)